MTSMQDTSSFLPNSCDPALPAVLLSALFLQKIKKSNSFLYSGKKPYNFTREISSCQVFYGQFFMQYNRLKTFTIQEV
jgi:hypothetical protein